MQTWSDVGIEIPVGASGEIRTTCPICSPTRHKKNDRCLGVNLDKKAWNCFHCGWTGTLSKDRPAEHHEKTTSANYKSFAHTHVDLPFQFINWLKSRGISEKTINDNQLSCGNFAQGILAVKFPYFKNGVVVNAKYRTLDKKFRQEKNPEPCLYRFDAVDALKCEELIICEGEMDALACYEAGITNAVSVPNGAPALDAKNFEKAFVYLDSAKEILDRCRRVVLAVDNDAPGKKLEAELSRRVGIEKCFRVQFPDGCKDANDVLMKHGKMVLREVIKCAKAFPVSGIFSVGDIRDLVLNLYDNGTESGVGTGWSKMDEFYTVKPGQMTIITGIPSSGKSNWLDALLVNLVLHHEWSFAIFSPENWPIERHAQSIIEKLLRKPFCPSKFGFDKQTMSREELEGAIKSLSEDFHFIMPEEELLTVDNILEKARIEIFRHGIRGVVIDPWNELDHDFGRLTETQYISSMLGKIRRFARRNNVHVWIVAHPQKLIKNGNGGYDPPTMYEISGGAHWRNKADVGICVHRPDIKRDETQVIVQKVRFREIGKPGAVMFGYNRSCGTYTDIEVLG